MKGEEVFELVDKNGGIGVMMVINYGREDGFKEDMELDVFGLIKQVDGWNNSQLYLVEEVGYGQQGSMWNIIVKKMVVQMRGVDVV